MTGNSERLAARVDSFQPRPGANRTLADVLLTWATVTPERTAVVDDTGTYSWSALRARVSSLAAGLRQRGLRFGEAVAVASAPGADMIALYLATAECGLVLVPLNLRSPAHDVAQSLTVARPSLVLASSDFASLVSGGDCVVGDESGSWADKLAAEPDVAPAREAGPQTPHLLLFTSGTTGRPKAALFDQRRSMGDAAAAALASGVRGDDRLLAYQPLFHTGGWDFLKQYLFVGASIAMMPAFDPERALDLIEEHRCTALFAVPLVLLRLMESPRFDSADLSSMRRLMFASYEPSELVPRSVEALRRRGARSIAVEHVYGQTEAGSFITTLRPEDATPATLDSVGTPVPGVTVALLDNDLNPVASGEIGEVCVRSETVMIGYVDDPAATDEAFRGGWLHTGDLGRQDRDGLLRLTGRLREMVRSAGENVFPKQVEEVLVTHPDVVDCAVFGIPDERWDERVAAAVVLSPGARTSIDDLTTFLRGRLAGYQIPRVMVTVDELPKTPAGKTARARLPQLLLGGADRAN